MTHPLCALALLSLLTPAVARGQDMPLFTFLPADSRWTPGGDVYQTGCAVDPGSAPADPTGRRATSACRSPDGGTVFAGYEAGNAVWAFRLGADGKPTAGSPYCPLRMPTAVPSLPVRGLTVDTDGRVYASTDRDIQIFDPTGRLCGVIALPRDGTPGWLRWAGENRDRLAVGLRRTQKSLPNEAFAVTIETHTFTRPMNARGMK